MNSKISKWLSNAYLTFSYLLLLILITAIAIMFGIGVIKLLKVVVK